MVWPAVIAAGAALGSTVLGNRSSRKAQSRNFQHERELRAEDRAFAEHWRATDIPTRVKAAREAGINPLIALGAGTTSSPASTVGGFAGHQGDDYSGLAEAGAEVSRHLENRAARKRQNTLDAASLRESNARAKAAEAQANRDNTAAALAASQHAREKHVSNVSQDSSALLTGPNQGTFRTSPSTTAEQVEQQYGGIAGEIHGLRRLMHDWLNRNQRIPKSTGGLYSRYRKAQTRPLKPKKRLPRPGLIR